MLGRFSIKGKSVCIRETQCHGKGLCEVLQGGKAGESKSEMKALGGAPNNDEN